MVGKTITEIKQRSGVPEPRLGTLLVAGLDGHEVTDREVSMARADGSAVWGVFNTSVLRGSDGLLTELTVMVRPYSAATALRERMAALLQ